MQKPPVSSKTASSSTPLVPSTTPKPPFAGTFTKGSKNWKSSKPACTTAATSSFPPNRPSSRSRNSQSLKDSNGFLLLTCCASKILMLNMTCHGRSRLGNGLLSWKLRRAHMFSTQNLKKRGIYGSMGFTGWLKFQLSMRSIKQWVSWPVAWCAKTPAPPPMTQSATKMTILSCGRCDASENRQKPRQPKKS